MFKLVPADVNRDSALLASSGADAPMDLPKIASHTHARVERPRTLQIFGLRLLASHTHARVESIQT